MLDHQNRGFDMTCDFLDDIIWSNQGLYRHAIFLLVGWKNLCNKFLPHPIFNAEFFLLLTIDCGNFYDFSQSFRNSFPNFL